MSENLFKSATFSFFFNSGSILSFGVRFYSKKFREYYNIEVAMYLIKYIKRALLMQWYVFCMFN